jgi:hypothetical protein
MLSKVLIAVVLTSSVVAAQGGGLYSGMAEAERNNAQPTIGRPKTIFEQFTEVLKLDQKTQVPGVEEIMTGAAKEAAPIAQEMLRTRQLLANAELGSKPDEVKTALDAYTVSATKMAALEAQAFSQVYALLKPNQQSKAAEAFATMAGIFAPASPAAPRPGQRGGGGR